MENLTEAKNIASPITIEQRFLSLDLIRGIAIMGILMMNIQSFGNLFSSYFNPTVNGDFSGINLATWFVTHIFFEQKFYTIFSMLFGAGIVLMAQSATAKGVSAAKYHYRRSILLIIFGLSHGFLIWYGDILNTYGFMALLVFLMWKKSAKTQIITGSSLVLMVSLIMLTAGSNMPEEAILEMQQNFIPDQTTIDSEVLAYQGSWLENFGFRYKETLLLMSYTLFAGARIAGGMLIGMALFQLGILTAQRSKSFYLKLTLICLLPSTLIIAYGATLLYQSGFQDAIQVQMNLAHFNFLGSIFMALGYIGLFNLIFLSDGCKWFKRKLQAVGQMAFSNYISQSIIATSIFYGFGLGLFGTLTRFELILVGLAILTLQVFWSEWWLKRFYFGPLEWVWRSLTYFKIQAFKK